MTIGKKAILGLGLFFVAVASVCLSTPTQAHSLYIQSSRYHVSEGKSSPLFFCYGHHIPVDDGGPGPEAEIGPNPRPVRCCKEYGNSPGDLPPIPHGGL